MDREEDYFQWPGMRERMDQIDSYDQKEAERKAEISLRDEQIRRKLELDKFKTMAQAMQRYPSPPHPDTALANQLRQVTKALRADQTALMEAIRRDLALIRATCGQSCDCPAEVPSTSCPNNKLAHTMTALVAAAMKAVEG